MPITEARPRSCQAPVRAERYDAISYRLIRDGDIVGFALAMSNGGWAMFDLEERRIGRRKWATPEEVAKAFEAMAGD